MALYRRRLGRRRSEKIVYPFPLRYRGHAEFGCHPLVPGTRQEALLGGLEESRRAGGHFCLATHYWELDETLGAILRAVIAAAAREPAVAFVPAAHLFGPAGAA